MQASVLDADGRAQVMTMGVTESVYRGLWPPPSSRAMISRVSSGPIPLRRFMSLCYQ